MTGREMKLTEAQREAATSFLADAITFAMGAQVETDLGLGRWGNGPDWPERVAAEWIDSGMGDEDLGNLFGGEAS